MQEGGRVVRDVRAVGVDGGAQSVGNDTGE